HSTVKVYFGADPSAAWQFPDVVRAVAKAHGVELTEAMSKEIKEQYPSLGKVCRLRDAKVEKGAAEYTLLRVSGSGRYVLGDNSLSHNCGYPSIIGGLVHVSFKDLAAGIT